jgi:glucosylglycerate hydrolase
MSRTRMAAYAEHVLRGNDRGGLTVASPHLYPHMWSWDAAFIAIGLARVSASRAITELETLLASQWRNGMVPHIVFTAGDGRYEPGPQRWACRAISPDAPHGPETSGLIQPPVHGIAVRRILDATREADAAERCEVRDRIRALWPALLAWHRYLVTHRDPDGRGLLTIYHGWESGLDNSPRWDAPYAAVVPDPRFAPFDRADLTTLGDGAGGEAQRPTDADYAKYHWLIEELRRARYDDAHARRTLSFRAADVLAAAVFAAANEELASVAGELGLPGAQELTGYARRFRLGVLGTTDEQGLAADLDLRAGTTLRTQTIAGFAPLLCGGLDPARQRSLLAVLGSADWCGHPAFAYPLPPSTSPASPAFDPVRYWRGPQWPPMTWLLIWGLERSGDREVARALREAALDQLSDGLFAEYYQPFTAEPLGAYGQSWTAAVALDLLAD